MTETTNTTTTDANAMPWPESPTMDLQGVQAILQLLAWAEDSMPYESIGETRRLALMLLEHTMGRAMRNLGMENRDMERDKAAAAAKPVAEPVQAKTDIRIEDAAAILKDAAGLLEQASDHADVTGCALLDAARRMVEQARDELAEAA